MILTFEIFGRARNHGKKFLKLCQTSFSGIVHWFLRLVFDKFDCIFIDNGMDMQYKKQDWFLECQNFLRLYIQAVH